MAVSMVVRMEAIFRWPDLHRGAETFMSRSSAWLSFALVPPLIKATMSLC